MTVSETMRAVKSKNTGPELVLRKALWRRGHRYRLNVDKLPGKPDIVFIALKIAIFVDGDFWHGNQWKLRGKESLEDQLTNVNNKEYWIKKIKRNMARDKRNNAVLKKEGYIVVRIWESSIIKSTPKAVLRIEHAIEKRG